MGGSCGAMNSGASTVLSMAMMMAPKDLKLPPIGLASCDEFVEKFNEVITELASIVDPLFEKKKILAEALEFKSKPTQTSMEKLVKGLILQLLVLAQGDLSKVKFSMNISGYMKSQDLKELIKVSLTGITLTKLEAILDAVRQYVEAMVGIFVDKLPGLVEKITALVAAGTEAMNSAQNELEGIEDMMQKMTIGKNVATVISKLSNAPKFVKDLGTDAKKDIDDLTQLGALLTNVDEMNKLAAFAKECAAKSITSAEDCYMAFSKASLPKA